MLKTLSNENRLTPSYHENSGRKSNIKFKHCFFLFVFILSCMAMNALCGETSTFKNPATQILQLQKGWNLCALTIAPDADSIAILTNHGVCWGWKNGRFRLLETFLPGQGFWTYSDENVQLTLTGEAAGSAPLHSGWNLVGIDAGIQEKLSRDGLHAWRFDQKSYLQAGDTFLPGLGYWIFKPSVIKPRISYILVPTDGMWRIDGGDWNDSGVTVTTEIGAHTISFQPIDGYTTPADETVTLAEGEKLSKNVEYAIIPPTVTVTLNPASGKWRLDNGDWNDSSATVATTVGEHTVSFDSVDGYTTPVNETITLTAGEKFSKTIDYEAIPPTVTVTLNPVTGKWRLDYGDWNDSGATVTTEVGEHTISFEAVDGYTTPAAQIIVLAAGERLSQMIDYEDVPPSVTYTLNPTSGKWRMDNGEWYESGTTITTIAGSHRISFKAIDGYTTPAAQNIILTMGQNLSRTVNYVAKQPTVTYTLSPTSGKWRLDNGEWNKSGATVTTTAGEHTVSFDAIDGYTTPIAQNITLQIGENLSQNVTYEVIQPIVTYTLDPPNGKWRIDDGDWNDSGITVTTTVGSHTISFMEIDGYTTLSLQSITLTAGQQLSKSVYYTPIQPTVSYTLNPTSGKWRLDDGEWNKSGITMTTTAGEHTVSFQEIDGYTTPTAQAISLKFGDHLSENVTYEIIPPTITYTLNPTNGKWCIDDGEWNDSGVTVTTTIGSHTISFQEVEGYKTPANQNLSLAAGTVVTKTASYTVIKPTVCYTLEPTTAKWRIDNGSWNVCGATVTTTVGNHKISFQTVEGYTTPDAQNITLVAGENLTQNVTYEVIQPTITFTLYPENGKWRIDNGAWNDSGVTVTTTVGLHTISFQEIEGYNTPANQNLTLLAGTVITRTVSYTVIQPTVCYILDPTTAKWRIDNGSWNDSGTTVTTTVGTHKISFQAVDGYTTPAIQNITLVAGENLFTNVVYDIIQPTVTYTLNPSTGMWRIDNGEWNDSGATVTTTVGSHTISFQEPDGYKTPVNQDINLVAGERLSKNVEYEIIPPTITCSLNPPNGKWRLDNGDWNDSDIIITTTAGEHSVSFHSIEKYITPEKQDITLVPGERLTKLVVYEPIPPTVTYTLNLPNGKWRIDDGDWNDSGATVTTTVGEHSISFQRVPRYLSPSAQSLVLDIGQNYSGNADYAMDDTYYAVVDLSAGPDAQFYPVRYTAEPPNLDDDTCRSTELWLCKIPAGTFIMGSPEEEEGHCSNETQHEVTLTQDYYMGIFECTQLQWLLVMGTVPLHNRDDFCPITNINYDMIRGTSDTAGGGWPRYGHTVDATSFMGKLQAKTDLTFDLPTEAQWEYACRAGTTTALNSGKNLNNPTDEIINEVGWISSQASGNQSEIYGKVGSLLPNAWGLYDMHGNVAEWCLDWYDNYSTTAVSDPTGPNLTELASNSHEHVLRGGYTASKACNCRSAYRWHIDVSQPLDHYLGLGFRVTYLPKENKTINNYSVSIIEGMTNISSASEGTNVLISANEPSYGMMFSKWVSNDAVLADTTATTTTFTMPAKAVSVKATYVPIPEPGNNDDAMYVVVDLSGGPNATNYPVRYTNVPPDLNTDICRTTELWLRKISKGTFITGIAIYPNGSELTLPDNLPQRQTLPQREVRLTQDYYMGVFECTQRQWELVMGDKPSYFSNAEYYATRPVESVSYYQIRGREFTLGGIWPRYGHVVETTSFMGRLQAKTGLVFDLPTETQWEYACRAGTTTLYNHYWISVSWNSTLNLVGRNSYNGGREGENSPNCTTDIGTAKVGSYQPNAWGLYDMHGNVYEWCLDAINTNSTYDPFLENVYGDIYSEKYKDDPAGSAVDYPHRVIRGGSWNNSYSSCYSIKRNGYHRSGRFNEIGFRVACHPKQDEEYLVIDLSGGPDAESYPYRYMRMGPCVYDQWSRITDLWLRKIPAGTFIMGSPENELGRADNETQHVVTLTQDYYIGVFECTIYQWKNVTHISQHASNDERGPVHIPYNCIFETQVIRQQISDKEWEYIYLPSFIDSLQTKTGLRFNLPTEAQWEYACRAGTTTALNSGKNLTSTGHDDAMDEVGRYSQNGAVCEKAGWYLPNAWGLYDMHGNAREWCLDWWDGGDYTTEPVIDPKGQETGTNRVVRGGECHSNARFCRSASRAYTNPSSSGVGFRIICLP